MLSAVGTVTLSVFAILAIAAAFTFVDDYRSGEKWDG